MTNDCMTMRLLPCVNIDEWISRYHIDITSQKFWYWLNMLCWLLHINFRFWLLFHNSKKNWQVGILLSYTYMLHIFPTPITIGTIYQTHILATVYYIIHLLYIFKKKFLIKIYLIQNYCYIHQIIKYREYCWCWALFYHKVTIVFLYMVKY